MQPLPPLQQDMHPKAWALRATPYATVHGATWAQRISKMPPHDAAGLLSSLAMLPGAKRLIGGRRTTTNLPVAIGHYISTSTSTSTSTSQEPHTHEPHPEEEEDEEASYSAEAHEYVGKHVSMAMPDGTAVTGIVQAVRGQSGESTRYWVVGDNWRPLVPAWSHVIEAPARGKRSGRA